MFKRIITAALVFGAAAAAPPAAEAQTICGPHEQLTDQLQRVFDESRRGMGLRNPTSLYELWVSEKTGTWTFLVVRPDGLACPVASGGHWTETVPDGNGTGGDPV